MDTMEPAVPRRKSQEGPRSPTAAVLGSPERRSHVTKNIVGCRRPECYREKRRMIMDHRGYAHGTAAAAAMAAFF